MIRRLAALEDPASVKPLTTGASIAPHPSSMDKYKGMAKEDIAIAQRLQALKDSRKEGTTIGINIFTYIHITILLVF